MRRYAWWKEIERLYRESWFRSYFPPFDPEWIKVVKKERETPNSDERVILDAFGETIVIERMDRQGQIFLFQLNWEADNTIMCRSVHDVARTLMTTTITLKYITRLIKETRDGMSK